jgi:hypothetical protein
MCWPGRRRSAAFAAVSGSTGSSIITVAPRNVSRDGRFDGSAQRWDITRAAEALVEDLEVWLDANREAIVRET